MRDFSERTLCNLKYVETGAMCNQSYEATQLVNSLLGLILIPVETYRNTYIIDDNKLKDLSESNYDIIFRMIKKCYNEHRLYSDYYKNAREKQNGIISVSKFISHLRNAIAHGGNHGIHFYPVSEGGTISSLIFYDNNEIQK